MRIAFLDLDHTLLVADSNQLWMTYLHDQRLVADTQLAEHEQFMDDYARGVLNFSALQSFRTAIDASLDPEHLRACQQTFERDVLLPSIAPQAPALLQDLRRQGLTTVVVSATRASLVEPVARHLGIDHVFASCFGADKVKRVEAWLSTLGGSLAALAESRFYSDSHNDVPLLEAVQQPVAVDPDHQLARLARNKRWPVISLRAA